jgi:hypothetical protein
MRKLAAEFLGTFALVFAGTGAIVINDVQSGTITHVGIALTFGLVVLAMIYAVGDGSGAHLNPAVTFGFLAARRLPARWAAPYVTSQCFGALTASALLRALFPGHLTLGVTLPAGPAVHGDAVEAYSAGSLPSGRVNPRAVEFMREKGCDLGSHRSKGLHELLAMEFDVAVGMGCGMRAALS